MKSLDLIIGSIILLITGIIDDIKPLKAKHKLIGQIVAALIVVFYGEILLRDIFLELQMEKTQNWEKEIMKWASNESCGPTEKQRAEFEQKLDLEIKRIWEQKQQVKIKEYEIENSMDFS